ncbi:MAG: hypothetical protein K5634_07280 [Sphaerochaetaceae bacterium]|nr:hypothetical protein [Sphaerochaetaceae bacterium]
MHGDLKGLLYTLLLIGSCGLVSLFIEKKNLFGNMSSEISRKVVHIGVSNWFFIWRDIFVSPYIPVAGLLAFAVINTFVTIRNGNKRWGLTYYPIAIMLIICARSFLGFGTDSSVGTAILGMGYGDGLAAICGILFSRHRVGFLGEKLPGTEKKTAGGSLVFIICVFTISKLFGASAALSILLALCGAFVEAYTPYGLDNFTVPGVLFLVSSLAGV